MVGPFSVQLELITTHSKFNATDYKTVKKEKKTSSKYTWAMLI